MIAVFQSIVAFFIWLLASPVRWLIALALMLFGLLLAYLRTANKAVSAVSRPVIRRFARLLAALTARPGYQAVVGWLGDLYVVLWICRVSVVSVGIGLVLAWNSPQARDLLLDVRSQMTTDLSVAPISIELGSVFGGVLGEVTLNNLAAEILHAGVLALSVLLFWALPVQVCARWSLESRAQSPRTELAQLANVPTWPNPLPDTYLRRFIPVLLGVCCFTAMLIAIAKIGPGLFDDRLNQSAGFAKRQLFLLNFALCGAILLYGLAVSRSVAEGFGIVAIAPAGAPPASPAHALAKLVFLLEETLQNWAGLAAFVVTGILFYFIVAPQLSTEYSRALVIPLVLGAAVPLLSLLAWLSAVLRLPLLLIIISSFVILRTCVHEGHDVRMQVDLRETNEPRSLSLPDAVALWRKHNKCEDEGQLCPQPIVVAAAGGASRAAYITASTLGLFMDLTCHDEGPGAKAPGTCAATPEFTNRIFAISGVSGGALGAALVTSVLREFQENQTIAFADPPALAPCGSDAALSSHWFRREKPIGWRECFQMVLADDFLSPVVIGLAFRDQVPIVGRWIRDRAALLEDTWNDTFKRYVTLAPRFGQKALTSGSEQSALAAPFESLMPSARNWRPLLVLNGTSVASGRRILTTHFKTQWKASHDAQCLFKDAYDFRGMTQVLQSSNETWPCGAPAKPADGAQQPAVPEDDRRTFSIATAITNSARFPIISPAGTIRGSDGKQYVDRIVDGGYFENYGVTTAYDIAWALRTIGLDPVVLVITNEPVLAPRVKDLSSTARSLPPLPERSEGLPFAWARAPIGALLETRSSRGDLSMIRLVSLLEAATTETSQPGEKTSEELSAIEQKAARDLSDKNETTREKSFDEKGDEAILDADKLDDRFLRFAHVSVYPEFFEDTVSTAKPRFKDVSMSWWLSKPIQEYLDDQLFQTRFASGLQQQMLLRVCDWLGHPTKPELDLREACKSELSAAFINRDVEQHRKQPPP